MKQVAGKIRLELAQYRELAAFSQFGSDLDKDTQARLAQGERLMQVLRQPQYAPMAVEAQIMIIFAVINKYLADIPVNKVGKFEKDFLEFMDSHHAEIGKTIVAEGKITDETEQKLRAAIEEFLPQFSVE